ncbi:hypothetical protein Tco_0153063 [Tanacetum coccineum]
MPKPQSPLQEPSQENPPTTHSNHDSLKSHLLPLGDSCDTNVGQALIPSQSANQTQLTQPSFPYLLINPYMASMLHAQTPPSPQGDNQIQPSLPPSPSREMLIDDINQLQDLSNLLAIHLSQRNTPSSPYSPNLPRTINLNQVEQHVGYCPYYFNKDWTSEKSFDVEPMNMTSTSINFNVKTHESIVALKARVVDENVVILWQRIWWQLLLQNQNQLLQNLLLIKLLSYKKAKKPQPPFKIFYKNRGRSERIQKIQSNKFKIDDQRTGQIADKALCVYE